MGQALSPANRAAPPKRKLRLGRRLRRGIHGRLATRLTGDIQRVNLHVHPPVLLASRPRLVIGIRKVRANAQFRRIDRSGMLFSTAR